jgi:hypothetical protein
MKSHFNKHFPKSITFKQLNKREQAKALKINGDKLSIKSANKYFKSLRLVLKEALLEGYFFSS